MTVTSSLRRALGVLYPAGLAALALFALVLWWRDGMWWYGALPTHGMQLVVGFALAALVLFALMRAVGRHGQRDRNTSE